MPENTIRFSYSLGGPDPVEAVSNGVEAERLGYNFVWKGDHITGLTPNSAVLDAWTILASVGSQTESVKLGPGVTDVQRIHPAKTANIVSTLDRLTKGRAVLGIGAGEVMNVKPYGIPWESPAVRIKRLREAILVMKLLWSSSYENPVTFEGEFYRLEEAHLGLSAAQKPHPPVYIGAFTSPKMLTLIGELADGWYPLWNTPETLRERVGIIMKAAEKAGRSVREIDVVAQIPTIVTNDQSVREQLKKELRLTMVNFTYLLKDLGAIEIFEKLPKDLDYQYITPTLKYARAQQKLAEELHVPDEILEKCLDEMMAVGSVDHCIDSYERFIRVGATNINPSPPLARRENYEMVAKKIIPFFKSR